jgi:hypothetical protein
MPCSPEPASGPYYESGETSQQLRALLLEDPF